MTSTYTGLERSIGGSPVMCSLQLSPIGLQCQRTRYVCRAVGSGRDFQLLCLELPSWTARPARREWQARATEFQRFARTQGGRDLPPKIEKPPFYAVQIFPLTRKNMGGVLTDHSCRVVDPRDDPIPRLYAAGELSGFAGINGTAALEGTFLGPCVVTGRVAARTAVQDVRTKTRQDAPPPDLPTPPTLPASVVAHAHQIDRITLSHQCGVCHLAPD